MDGKLDTDWVGLPTEGYGFSNDATAVIGAPELTTLRHSWNECPVGGVGMQVSHGCVRLYLEDTKRLSTIVPVVRLGNR